MWTMVNGEILQSDLVYQGALWVELKIPNRKHSVLAELNNDLSKVRTDDKNSVYEIEIFKIQEYQSFCSTSHSACTIP